MRALGVAATGTAGGAEKCALARHHGFAEVIDYNDCDFVDAAKLIAPAGFHVVYDSVGRDTLQKSVDLCEDRVGGGRPGEWA